jgi:hypothetical protein
MDWNEYCFRNVLPLVLAFAAGVVMMDVAHERYAAERQVKKHHAHAVKHAANQGARCLMSADVGVTP